MTTLPMRAVRTGNPFCKNCGGTRVRKYGHYKGVQLYFCNSCRSKFRANDNLPGRRFAPVAVGASVAMFYEGNSVEQIRRHMAQIYDVEPSGATIYEWVTDYTNLAKANMKPHKANTGDTWVCDEMVLKVGGKKYWNWNVMDGDTRYVLATRISATRTSRDAEMVLKKARLAASRRPKFIQSDRLSSYVDGVERAFGAGVHHIPTDGLRATVNNNLSERLQGTIRARSKVMRGLKSQKTAQLVLDGWTIHYNHFRPHEALNGKTPGEYAGIEPPFKNWEDVARKDVRLYSQKRVLRESERLRERLFKPVVPKERKPHDRFARSLFRPRSHAL